MPIKRKDEKIKMVALLDVTSAHGVETIKTFDKAWHRALELVLPVNINFVQFVREDQAPLVQR